MSCLRPFSVRGIARQISEQFRAKSPKPLSKSAEWVSEKAPTDHPWEVKLPQNWHPTDRLLIWPALGAIDSSVRPPRSEEAGEPWQPPPFSKNLLFPGGPDINRLHTAACRCASARAKNRSLSEMTIIWQSASLIRTWRRRRHHILKPNISKLFLAARGSRQRFPCLGASPVKLPQKGRWKLTFLSEIFTAESHFHCPGNLISLSKFCGRWYEPSEGQLRHQRMAVVSVVVSGALPAWGIGITWNMEVCVAGSRVLTKLN